jgi:hypothetical protein
LGRAGSLSWSSPKIHYEELLMNTMPWPPGIGTWYVRWDKSEIFQVTGYDEKSRKATIETYDGDVGEIDEVTWGGLSLGLADPAEDWTAPVEAVDVVDLGSSRGDSVSEDVAEPRPDQYP